MRLPIKINEAFIPIFMRQMLKTQKDPRVLLRDGITRSNSHLLSVFKFGSTFKTTKANRHTLTDEYLKTRISSQDSVILDVGASDGTTSLELMNKVPFRLFFVTDYNLHVYYKQAGSRVFFYDKMGRCILFANDMLVIYPEHFRFFRTIFPKQSKVIGEEFNNLATFLLVNKELQDRAKQDDRIRIQSFNVFDEWVGEPLDLIKVANVLNRTYFSDNLIREAFRKMSIRLNENGFLVIIDNRAMERSTVWKKKSGIMTVVKNINGGSEVKLLVDQG